MGSGSCISRAEGWRVNHLATWTVFISALLSTGCSDDGLKGELATKPAYADMSSMYYGDMCKPNGPELEIGRTRAMRIETFDGKCASLYLDGVERNGELMIYPGGSDNPPACTSGLVGKLRHYNAHWRVVSEVQKLCGR